LVDHSRKQAEGIGMKELDSLMERIEKLYIPIRIKGKEYPANNPYLMN
jgi:hypothetical protein